MTFAHITLALVFVLAALFQIIAIVSAGPVQITWDAGDGTLQTINLRYVTVLVAVGSLLGAVASVVGLFWN